MRHTGLFKKAFQTAMYRLLYPLLVVILLVSAPASSLLHATFAADTSSPPAWASPSTMTLKRVGAASSTQHQPVFLSNLDCTALTYRQVNSSVMQTGCFTPTAFGMMDSGKGVVIFNGSDEAVPLTSYSAHEVLAPWPGALNLLTLDAADTGGSYVNMYKNPLSVMKDQRDSLGRLTSKQMTAPPDTPLRTADGRSMIAHGQSLAFSSNNSWLVVETIYGYFARINLATLQVVPFGPSYNSLGGSEPQDAQVAISDDGRFVAVANGNVSIFKVYDLATCTGNTTSWQANNCHSYDYWPFVSHQIAGLNPVRHVRFMSDGLLTFETTSGDPAGASVYDLAPTGSITSLIDYLGLGDSYTSGEGAFDYLTGTDTADNSCHLSAQSYPLLLSHDLFSTTGGHSVACSGAVINDVGSTSGSYKGQVKHGTSLDSLETAQTDQLQSILANYSPGYVPQRLFVKQYQPRLMTVSVGGNDIGFGDILQKCVVPHISRHISNETCYNTYESRLELVNLVNRTVPRWTSLFQQLRADSPGSTIYAVGYPSIASDTGSCPLNVNLGTSELEFAEELIHYLDGAIQQSSAAAGVPYVDISQALAGHRLCEASGNAVAVNGLTAGNDFGAFGVNVLGRESYHPNALGHELIEQAILRQTNNLTPVAGGSSAPVNDSQSLLNAPKTGRAVNTLVPDAVTSRLIRAGTSVSLQVDGTRDGLRPNNTYSVRLDGPSGAVLANLTSDASGNLSGTVAILGNTAPGGHTIDITGSDQTGAPIDVTQPVYVAGDTTDADGDGIGDAVDSCPYAINSGQDIDEDGVDDVCDALIGPPPVHDNHDNNEGTGQAGTPDPQPAGDDQTSPVQPALPDQTSDLVADLEQGVLVGSVLQSVKQAQNAISVGQVLGSHIVAGQPTKTAVPKLFMRPAGFRPQLMQKSGGSTNGSLSYLLLGGVAVLLPTIFYWRKIDYKKIGWCFTIVIMRKFGVVVFSVLLFISLLALAFSTSSNIAFTHPSKLEKWLNDSNLYGAFVENAIDQAEQTAGTDQSGGISLSDTAVKQAAESSFSSAALQHDVNTFLDSNYAWLNGKTAKPGFSIDLSGAKQDFAQKVGNYVKTYLAGLPACTAAQTAQINPQTADPLTLTCRPPNVDPTTEGAQVTEQIATSTEFLSDPVVTAANVNPNGSIDSPARPYYQKFSALPSAYQKATKIPWVAGAVALLSLIAIMLVSPRKRKGVKAVTITLALAGLVMVLNKFASDQLFQTIRRHAFDGSTAGELQKALTVFLRHAEDQLVKVDLWFGIGYLLLALVLLAVLIITRQRGLRIPKRLQSAVPTTESTPAPKAASQKAVQKSPKSRPPKPPRLVQ